MDIDNFEQEGVKVADLSDEELNKQLDQNLGVVDENKKVEETTPEPSTENKPNEDISPSSQGEKGKEDGKVKPADKNTEDEKDKDVPFHKHPRFQKLIQSKKELEEKNKAYEERLQKLENPLEQTKLPPIPPWFAGDENDWQTYNQELKIRDEKVKNDTITDIKLEQQQKENNVKKMEEWVDEEVEKLQDDPDTEDFKKNELLKVMTDYKPTDENGNLDFKKGYELLKKFGTKNIKSEDKKKEQLNEKKKVISTDLNTGSGGDDESKVVTADDIRHKSFGQLAI